MNSLEEIREKVLEEGGFVILGRGDNYDLKAFTYVLPKELGFGYAALNSSSYELNLSSKYDGGRSMGSGSQYRDDGPYTEDDLIYATRAKIGSGSVRWYEDIEDYLLTDFFFLFQSVIETKEGIKPAIEYLDDLFIYISDKHGAYINKRRVEMDRFVSRRDEFQALFYLKDGQMNIIESSLSDEAIKRIDTANNVDKILNYKLLSQGV